MAAQTASTHDRDETTSTVRAPSLPPLVQLVWDATQVARALAKTYERRVRPTKRGVLHRV